MVFLFFGHNKQMWRRRRANYARLMVKVLKKIRIVPPSVFYDPQFQTISCYIARYYERKYGGYLAYLPCLTIAAFESSEKGPEDFY